MLATARILLSFLVKNRIYFGAPLGHEYIRILILYFSLRSQRNAKIIYWLSQELPGDLILQPTGSFLIYFRTSYLWNLTIFCEKLESS